MAGKEVICTLTGICKRYEKQGAPVLGPLDLQLLGGEILGLQGANGAGKSTLMAIIAGVLRPDAGTIEAAPQLKGQTGYVPQELSLYETMTGLENLKFWGLVLGMPTKAIALRSAWLLEQLGLQDKGASKVMEYSGGMKRRLHLATALMATPQLLLLDEPTVGADKQSAELILRMLEHLRHRGCAIVLISHQAGEIAELCDRVLTLEKGLPVDGSEGA